MKGEDRRGLKNLQPSPSPSFNKGGEFVALNLLYELDGSNLLPIGGNKN
jgi:hypothetical protein